MALTSARRLRHIRRSFTRSLRSKFASLKRVDPASHQPPSGAKSGHRQHTRKGSTVSTENDIKEIVSRYTRAADRRDGTAMAALFETDAVSEIYLHGPDGPDDRE